jgi:hypothetical protein
MVPPEPDCVDVTLTETVAVPTAEFETLTVTETMGPVTLDTAVVVTR